MGLNKERLQQLMQSAAQPKTVEHKPNDIQFNTPTVQPQKAEAIKESVEERIELIPPERLRAFHTGNEQHVFKINDNKLAELRNSILENGILQPLTIRIDKKNRGDFEIIAGHHRWIVAKELQLPCPCMIKNMDDDTAIIHMVHTNKQRGFESMLPTEICGALIAEREAKSRQGKRTDLIENLEENNDADEKMMSTTNENRYLRLQYLTQDYKQEIDNGEMSLRTAVQISFINTASQSLLYSYCKENKILLPLAKAEQLRRAAVDGQLSEVKIRSCFEKKQNMTTPKKEKVVKLKVEKLSSFFDFDTVSQTEIENEIISALTYFRKNTKQKDFN